MIQNEFVEEKYKQQISHLKKELQVKKYSGDDFEDLNEEMRKEKYEIEQALREM